MNSTRVEEVAALRAQKKLDRQVEEDAALAKAEAETKAHEASMARIAKKMASLAGDVGTITSEPAAEEPAAPPPAQELPPVKPKKVAKKAAKKVAKKAAKKVAKKVAKTKPNTSVRSKGSKRKK